MTTGSNLIGEKLRVPRSYHEPFISRVRIKEHIGLPPITGTYISPVIRKYENYYDLQNKEIVKQIVNMKKTEKEYFIDEEKNLKVKYEKAYENNLKQSMTLNEIRKVLYGDLVNNKKSLNIKRRKTSDVFLDKNENKSHGGNYFNLSVVPKVLDYMEKDDNNLKRNNIENLENKNYITVEDNFHKNSTTNSNMNLLKLEGDENKEEIDKLLNFVNNLDYEKYTKDLETREALYLIKNKVEKDKTNLTEENKPKENIKIEEEEINEISIPTLNTNNTHYSETNQVVHEKEWDNSIEASNSHYNNEEFVKKEIAQKILKSDRNMRTVHSYNSVKRLLEREGLFFPSKLNTLRISIIKTKDGINNNDYMPNKLPNLRDLPII